MTRRSLLVWGTCWFDESPAALSNTLRDVTWAARALGVEIMQVIFDARHDRHADERARLAAATGARLLSHNIEAYPNKNLGVAMITASAKDLGADIVAVVDADWAFDDLSQFVYGLLTPLLRGGAVGVLPDISRWAGRANRLVGEPAMRLLRPGMGEVVSTPFPGAVAAVPEVLSDITTASGYHYDWGGEWDVADGLWSSGLVVCPELGMVNVRHRATASKAGDAFQIWRAILKRAMPLEIVPVAAVAAVAAAAEQLGAPMLVERLRGSATEQLAAFVEAPPVADAIAPTVAQLVPMVLAPLALLVDGMDTRSLKFPVHDTHAPYDRAGLGPLSILATQAAGSALSIRAPRSRPSDLDAGGPLGTWDPESTKAAQALVGECRWT